MPGVEAFADCMAQYFDNCMNQAEVDGSSLSHYSWGTV